MLINTPKPLLFVVVGPTGIGKTALSIKLAQHLQTEIISADSRQIYAEMHIGTAKPTDEELSQVKHHFIGCKSVHNYYSAYEYEQEVLHFLNEWYQSHNYIVMTGGSMMYVDAVCKGIDDIPTIDKELRKEIMERYEKGGLEEMRRELKRLDPVFYNQVDLRNAKRVIHAVEVCLMAGRPYSEMRTGQDKERPFQIVKIGLDMDRQELYDRINHRVDLMIEQGLVEEARELYQYKHLNALNTVGYKELYSAFDGEITLEEGIELIKRNSRRYAKRQLTWFRKDENTQWFHPNDFESVLNFVNSKLIPLGQ